MTVAKSLFVLLTATAAHAACFAAVTAVDRVTSHLTIEQGDDLHISAADEAIAQGAAIDMAGDDCRLFFDNIRPVDVIERYSGSVTIMGEKLEPDVNARIRVYLHGTEILPHSPGYTPLLAKSSTGKTERYISGRFYTNSPSADVLPANASPLALDNDIHSISLARGYMATLATNPDGTGYSRCFIAENENLNIDRLPRELDGKVSFVRVFPWKQVSKKGWVGGNNKTNPPEGYFEEQADALLTTWAYNWGTSADYGRSPEAKGTPWRNQEFVPEKWGYGGDSDWQRITADFDITHLLSYNEPDHGEQSDVSVERAIEEWPRHLHSGLRLGSPATTDFAWLYR
ncbi:MAG: glycoside hydrolase family protein, partial [Muribaculaceae bacterium]|nr:glycoside hydrolase family protein [Muribaculaceae bacterium]